MLTIVIPARNEAARLPATLGYLREHFRAPARRVETLVVDDGSDDGTQALVQTHFAGHDDGRLIQNPRPGGKGACVRLGMLEARGDLVLISDADLSAPIEELARLEAAIAAGCDVAIGSRALPESTLTVRQPFHRELLGRGFNLLVRALGLTRFRDTQCGFKLFTREAAREIFARQTIDRFAFDVEALWLAERLGFRVVEVPVTWRNDSSSRVRPLRDSLQMLADVVRLRLRAMASAPPRSARRPS